MVAAIVVALVAASNVAAAGAQPDVEEPVDIAVASYASDYSVTHEEAQRRLDRIQPLQDILALIRELESSRLAGWGIDHAGTFTGWVWLTGDQPPVTGAASIADAHTDVQIRTGAAHTRAELLTAQEQLFRSSAATGHTNGSPGAISPNKRIVTFTSIDMRTNALRIGIDPALDASTVPGGLTTPDPTAVTDEALQTKITQVTQQLQNGVEVPFAVVDGRGITAAESFAGGDAMGVCTSGFAAYKPSSGAYGMITAGHCGPNGPNDGVSQSMHGVALPFGNGWAGINADAQFHEIPTGSSHLLLDDYRCSSSYPNAYCDVTGDRARTSMLESYACHAGKNSGVSCGTITAIDYQPTHSELCYLDNGTQGECNSVFVEVEGPSLKSCSGDSGSPVYWSGIAYGIQMSGTTKDDCYNTGDSVQFSAIREVESFRVNVLFTRDRRLRVAKAASKVCARALGAVVHSVVVGTFVSACVSGGDLAVTPSGPDTSAEAMGATDNASINLSAQAKSAESENPSLRVYVGSGVVEGP